MAKKLSAEEYFELADSHFERVAAAWDAPTDWADLSMYGLYCIEALVAALARVENVDVPRNHWGKADLVEKLEKKYELSDQIDDLIRFLNEARKAHAYGDVEYDDDAYDPEDVAVIIEELLEQVREVLKPSP